MYNLPAQLRHLIGRHFFGEYQSIVTGLAGKFHMRPDLKYEMLESMRNSWIDTLKTKRFNTDLADAWHTLLSDFAPFLCSCNCVRFSVVRPMLRLDHKKNQQL